MKAIGGIFSLLVFEINICRNSFRFIVMGRGRQHVKIYSVECMALELLISIKGTK
jgi:hypothetical protein